MQTHYIDSPNFVDAIIQITKGYKPFQKKLCWCTDDLHQQSLKHLWVKVEQNMTKTYAYLLVKWNTPGIDEDINGKTFLTKIFDKNKTHVPLGKMKNKRTAWWNGHARLARYGHIWNTSFKQNFWFYKGGVMK